MPAKSLECSLTGNPTSLHVPGLACLGFCEFRDAILATFPLAPLCHPEFRSSALYSALSCLSSNFPFSFLSFLHLNYYFCMTRKVSFFFFSIYLLTPFFWREGKTRTELKIHPHLTAVAGLRLGQNHLWNFSD